MCELPGSYILLLVCWLVTVMLALNWRRNYFAAKREIVRLQSALDAKTIRLDKAPKAGDAVLIQYQTNFGEG